MSYQEMQRSIGKNAFILGLFTVIAVSIVALIQQNTKQPILDAQRLAKQAALAEVLPVSYYDNNLLENQISLDDPLLGNRTAAPAYLATLQGEPAAVILQATAPDGYSGNIELLIGILANGQLSGVRVVQHKETPGLGDKIELAKDNWIKSFDGKSLNSPAAERWAVKKDRGDFDQFAGATITPRAVIAAVQRALQFFDANRDQLFLMTPQTLPQEAKQ